MFKTLFMPWCNNPVATFSLCLLAEAYDLGAAVVCKLYACSCCCASMSCACLRGVLLPDSLCARPCCSSEFQVTVGMLMQVDKLVQLLESPVFLRACGLGWAVAGAANTMQPCSMSSHVCPVASQQT